MLVIRRLFGTGTNCIAPSGLPLLLCLFPGLAPWAFLCRPCGASFAPETSLVLLGGRQVHKLVKFRPRGMVDKREMEQAQLFETADERGCTPMFGAAHRRASAVPYPRRYEVCSLFIASDPHTAQSCTGETPVPRWLRGMAVPAMIQNLTDL